MGFRNGAYASVWEVTPISDTMVKARISTSRKNKKTNEYETDFSGFVSFLGSAAAKKAAQLKERDRIHLENVDVTTSYNKEKKVGYTNFNVFGFEVAESNSSSPSQNSYETQSNPVDGGAEVDDSGLPF